MDITYMLQAFAKLFFLHIHNEYVVHLQTMNHRTMDKNSFLLLLNIWYDRHLHEYLFYKRCDMLGDNFTKKKSIVV
jgi:hypothetical protein